MVPENVHGGMSVGRLLMDLTAICMTFVLITGIVIWWPKNKEMLKNRLTIDFRKGFGKFVHDSHVVLGIYACIFLLLMTITDPAFGLNWYREGLMLNMVPALAEGEGYSARYVSLGHQSAVVYQPTVKSAKTGIGIVVMHSDEDYMAFLPNPELSKRGYTVIATVPVQGKVISEKLLNIKACVEYLRNNPDIRKVILLGHSGGATVMTAYQLVAESHQ